MSETSNLAIIIGSVREARFGPVVANWVAEQSRQHGAFDVNVIDLADVELPLTLPALPPLLAEDDNYPRPEAMADLTRHLDDADAFIIVTPEYNNSYPASLKSAIDWHFTQWAAKPVAFVSYAGGSAGGRHAVLHLANVFTELHAVIVRGGLSFPRYYLNFDLDTGTPLDDEVPGYAKSMLEQLAWWARALRTARERAPYPG